MRILTLLIIGAVAVAQQSFERPSFNHYPARSVFRGKPHVPILNRDQRTFRTMIRTGANHPVEFAGHYTIPRWGCGSGCNGFAIVDSISGKVYEAPFAISELPGAWYDDHGGNELDRMEFRPDSKLLRLNGCANERQCGFYDFVMQDGQGLKLVRKKLLPPKYQPNE